MAHLSNMNISKIFGKGISIPKKYTPMLPPFAKEFTKARIDQINKASYQSGGRLVIKPTRKQIEGGFLGTLASTGIPMAIGLRWLNTVLAVCECMSLAKSWQEKGCSSEAETWQVKSILMKDFD